MDSRAGVVTVGVRSPISFTAEEEGRFGERFRSLLGFPIRFDVDVDPKLLGGAVFTLPNGDTYDYSFRSVLDGFKTLLMEIR